MVGTIDMQFMRYLNMFNKVCRVETKYCFRYNNQLIFVVPMKKVSLAIGPQASKAKTLAQRLGRKIKVVGMTKELTKENIEKFITSIIDPITFNKLELKGKQVVIIGGRQTRASLIGRNRVREQELLKILNGIYGIESIKFN
jgi:transcription antitermination factor NusA-like protein